VELTPTFAWQSEVFFQEDNDPLLKEEAYGVLDIRARLMGINRHWELEAFAENVTDERFIIDAGNTGASFGTPTFIAAPPRLYGAGLTIRY
jgi:outer membrane receptor protein involved in Fe transport